VHHTRIVWDIRFLRARQRIMCETVRNQFSVFGASMYCIHRTRSALANPGVKFTKPNTSDTPDYIIISRASLIAGKF